MDPFVGADDEKKPLLNKLLAVPALRARYLGYVRQMAEEWLNWGRVGPLAAKSQALIAEEVKADTHKRDAFEAFKQGVSGADSPEPAGGGQPMRGPQRASISLKSFVEQRRAYLLNHAEVKGATLPGRR